MDMLLPQRNEWELLILGSNMNESASTRAQPGHYGQWSFHGLPPTLQ